MVALELATVSAFAKYDEIFYVMGKVLSGELSCMMIGLVGIFTVLSPTGSCLLCWQIG